MQPHNPNHQFDFMLKNNQAAKRGLPLPNLPKPVLIGLAIILVAFLVIIVDSVLSGRKGGSYQPIVNSLARSQEILRVTDEAKGLNLHDPATTDVAATVTTALSGDQAQLSSYLSRSHSKVTKLQLSADVDKSIDDQLKVAAQHNNLDQTYITYLQQNLVKYQRDLQAAYAVSGTHGKDILKRAIDGQTALLTNAPLKT
jgi:hypothetical protein